MPEYGEIVKDEKRGIVGRFVCKSDRFEGAWCVRTLDGQYTLIDAVAA